MTLRTSVDDFETRLQHLTARTLSAPSRYAHVALLLAAVLMGVLLASLLATESALPGRTRIALSTMLAIAGAWSAYAGWVLTRRKPLLAQHRLVAAWMAVAFTGLFAVGAGLLAAASGAASAVAACGTGVALLAVATWLLARARREVSRLRAQVRELVG